MYERFRVKEFIRKHKQKIPIKYSYLILFKRLQEQVLEIFLMVNMFINIFKMRII